MPAGQRRRHRRLKGEVKPWLAEQRRLVSSYNRKNNVTGGDTRHDPQFMENYRIHRDEIKRLHAEERAVKAGRIYRGIPADTSPEGVWANALIKLGRREQGDWWSVGDTPPTWEEVRAARGRT